MHRCSMERGERYTVRRFSLTRYLLVGLEPDAGFGQPARALQKFGLWSQFTNPTFLGICASGAGAACDFHKKVASYRINVRNEHMEVQSEENLDESEDNANHDYCETCCKGSNDEDNPLIMCDGCPASYHFTCLQKLPDYELIQTLEELPQIWYCGHSQCVASSSSRSPLFATLRCIML